MRAAAIGFWIVVFFTASDDLVLPFLARDTFRRGPVTIGVLLAAASLGFITGGSRWSRRSRARPGCGGPSSSASGRWRWATS